LHRSLVQAAFTGHALPAADSETHAPAALQYFGAVQPLPNAFVTVVHAPVPAAHMVHVPVQVVVAQQFTLQRFDVQSPFPPHPVPTAPCM
jgi:hypothetical protein